MPCWHEAQSSGHDKHDSSSSGSHMPLPHEQSSGQLKASSMSVVSQIPLPQPGTKEYWCTASTTRELACGGERHAIRTIVDGSNLAVGAAVTTRQYRRLVRQWPLKVRPHDRNQTKRTRSSRHIAAHTGHCRSSSPVDSCCNPRRARWCRGRHHSTHRAGCSRSRWSSVA